MGGEKHGAPLLTLVPTGQDNVQTASYRLPVVEEGGREEEREEGRRGGRGGRGGKERRERKERKERRE